MIKQIQERCTISKNSGIFRFLHRNRCFDSSHSFNLPLDSNWNYQWPVLFAKKDKPLYQPQLQGSSFDRELRIDQCALNTG